MVEFCRNNGKLWKKVDKSTFFEIEVIEYVPAEPPVLYLLSFIYNFWLTLYLELVI